MAVYPTALSHSPSLFLFIDCFSYSNWDFNRLTGLLCGREIWNDTVDEVYVESAL